MRPLAITAAVFVAFCLAAPALAQSARATGTVRDTGGKPLKGATVRAINKDAYPPEIASSTDDKGRWAMIGLRTGTWTFVAEAPGFTAAQTPWPVRVGGTQPIPFVLARDLGPIPNALTRTVQQQITTANGLRDKGQIDQAISAYEQVRDQNPKLTAVNLVVASAYRQKAAQETNPSTRRTLLERAITSYTTFLSSEPDNEEAKTELATVRAEASALK
ncbi:MAG TPA: carboxypeptidase-like regulatory domain-containing protein [Vicinamibacterales bacterium]|nr:carboxypeptidase-like regulatory domain-containing protein [Vicinamibacterales bacterium]